jgi:hypothetical protein
MINSLVNWLWVGAAQFLVFENTHKFKDFPPNSLNIAWSTLGGLARH